jgi:hypothetical protein
LSGKSDGKIRKHFCLLGALTLAALVQARACDLCGCYTPQLEAMPGMDSMKQMAEMCQKMMKNEEAAMPYIVGASRRPSGVYRASLAHHFGNTLDQILETIAQDAELIQAVHLND